MSIVVIRKANRIKSNNNQYQFEQMLAQKYSNRNLRQRQISFSDWQNPSQSTPNSFTPNHPQKLSRSSSRYHNASPLHNLHYKYLPENYVSPERMKESRENASSASQLHLSKSYVEKAEGINKINSKIKNILESIEQEEKRKEVYVKKYANDLPKTQTNNHQKETACIRQENSNRITNKNDFCTPLRDKNMNKISFQNSGKYSNLSSIKAEEKQNISIHRQYASKLKQSNVSSDHESKGHASVYQMINSRYLNYSASRMKKANDDVVVNGKNVDREIDRIQKKIEELEQIKKKLGVSADSNPNMVSNHTTVEASQANETPAETTLKSIQLKQDSKFTYQSSQNSLVKQVNKIQTTTSEPEPFKKACKTEEGEKIESFQAMAKSELFNLRQNFNNEDVKLPKILRDLTSKRKKAIKPRAQTESTECLQVQSTVSQFFNTTTQTPQSLQTARQKNAQIQAKHINAALSTFHKHQPNELKRLLMNLQKQIKADDELRKAKKWFQRMKNECKWSELDKCMRKSGMNMGSIALKQVFNINSQEENPFYTPRQQDYTIGNLVQAFKATEQTWSQDIVGHYSLSKLRDSSFVESNIDISQRGYISIEDMVRFINYQLDTCYRNRDLYLIYHRFKKNTPLRFQHLMACLTHQSY